MTAADSFVIKGYRKHGRIGRYGTVRYKYCNVFVRLQVTFFFSFPDGSALTGQRLACRRASRPGSRAALRRRRAGTRRSPTSTTSARGTSRIPSFELNTLSCALLG